MHGRKAQPRPLQPDEIALCEANLRRFGLGQALAVLSSAERTRARRITNRDYFAQHVKARALLRLLLARLTGSASVRLAIAGGDGAPRLAVNPWGLHLSVSHSHSRVLVAAGGAPLGVDIERKQTGIDWQPIADVCFHASELTHLAHTEAAAREEAFFAIWTRKEAYLKATGTGLGSDPASFSILGPRDAITPDSQAPARCWYTHTIEASAGYAAALASRARGPRLIHFDFAQLLPTSAATEVQQAA